MRRPAELGLSDGAAGLAGLGGGEARVEEGRQQRRRGLRVGRQLKQKIRSYKSTGSGGHNTNSSVEESN